MSAWQEYYECKKMHMGMIPWLFLTPFHRLFITNMIERCEKDYSRVIYFIYAIGFSFPFI